MNDTERQLWLWLADCELRKPVQNAILTGRDKVVRSLQYEVREGSEAKEAEDVS